MGAHTFGDGCKALGDTSHDGVEWENHEGKENLNHADFYCETAPEYFKWFIYYSDELQEFIYGTASAEYHAPGVDAGNGVSNEWNYGY